MQMRPNNIVSGLLVLEFDLYVILCVNFMVIVLFPFPSEMYLMVGPTWYGLCHSLPVVAVGDHKTVFTAVFACLL